MCCLPHVVNAEVMRVGFLSSMALVAATAYVSSETCRPSVSSWAPVRGASVASIPWSPMSYVLPADVRDGAA